MFLLQILNWVNTINWLQIPLKSKINSQVQLQNKFGVNMYTIHLPIKHHVLKLALPSNKALLNKSLIHCIFAKAIAHWIINKYVVNVTESGWVNILLPLVLIIHLIYPVNEGISRARCRHTRSKHWLQPQPSFV